MLAESMQWTTVIASQGEVPQPRLDFAFATLRLKVPHQKLTPQSVLDSKDPPTEKEQVGERVLLSSCVLESL